MAIFSAVHDRLLTLRVDVARLPQFANRGNDWGKLDDMIARAMDDAAAAAVRAAETGERKP